MSRTAILLQNLTDTTMTFASVDDKDPKSPAYRGTDWGHTVPKPGTAIGVSPAPIQLGSEGAPGSIETDHWGWIYFQRPDTNQKLQVFLHLTSGRKIVEVGVSNFDESSTKDKPYGHGHKFRNSASFHLAKFDGAVLVTMVR